ncbi:transcription factor IIA, alpha/beta subunit domain-containing protein [Ditylenchus destructor]|uniref:Transcription factor IIA, alpha/beta subunit domain-containing protein n=1 Tax=Ditylenchus destructor TaxID=166010 RepID=A0AAD4N8P7_9BILA|nr:transcription factor IIA, alpha/beta subunit domain-containing protein [Ditylenchus destructor]
MAGIEDIYEGVINDVINGVREAFLDENVDVDVLQQLRSSWEAKVKVSGAVDLGGPKNLPPPTIRQPQNRQTGSSSAPQANKQSTSGAVTHMQKVQEPPQRQNVILSQQQPVQQVAGTIVGNGSGLQYLQTGNSAQTLANVAGGTQLPAGLRLVPVSQNPNLAQYAIMQGLPGGGQNFMVIPATNSQQLPLNVANLAQVQPSNPAMRPPQPQLIAMKTEPNVHNNIGQLDGAGAIMDNELAPSNSKVKSTSLKMKKEKSKKHVNMIPQVDGGPGMSDSSSDEELDEEEDPLRRYANLEDDKLDDGDVVEEDPLNSNDDQSDDEDLDTLFDAEHVVVCQFEKVHRARTKWKFNLKDGIMHLKGKDYTFQKCLGEAEW